MNREIKFRIWSLEAEEMFEDFPLVKEDKYLNEILTDENYVFMQFTGLLDKNGKEIYEGDIVKYTNHSDGLNILIEEVKTKRFVNGFMPFNYTLDMDYTTLEVIGNIFENPDLIK